jgi:hypothetical protein
MTRNSLLGWKALGFRATCESTLRCEDADLRSQRPCQCRGTACATRAQAACGRAGAGCIFFTPPTAGCPRAAWARVSAGTHRGCFRSRPWSTTPRGLETDASSPRHTGSRAHHRGPCPCRRSAPGQSGPASLPALPPSRRPSRTPLWGQAPNQQRVCSYKHPETMLVKFYYEHCCLRTPKAVSLVSSEICYLPTPSAITKWACEPWACALPRAMGVCASVHSTQGAAACCSPSSCGHATCRAPRW